MEKQVLPKVTYCPYCAERKKYQETILHEYGGGYVTTSNLAETPCPNCGKCSEAQISIRQLPFYHFKEISREAAFLKMLKYEEESEEEIKQNKLNYNMEMKKNLESQITKYNIEYGKATAKLAVLTSDKELFDNEIAILEAVKRDLTNKTDLAMKELNYTRELIAELTK